LYQRVDQEELEKMGLGHKSELSFEQGSLKSLHKFSMLQRFRQSKDLKAQDSYKPKVQNKEEYIEIKEKEIEWWRTNALT